MLTIKLSTNTRKTLGFKSLRLNSSDITQVVLKSEMSTTVTKTLTYSVIELYFLKR